MLVRVLGPIEARASPDGAWIQPPPQQRLVLGMLAGDVGRVCRADRLVEALWGGESPEAGRRRVQILISRLRRVLELSGDKPRRLRSVPGGWQLDLDADAVDLSRFEALCRSGSESAGRPGRAREQLEEAMALWRGRPFGELADHPALVADSFRLEERHLAVRERLLELRLGAGEYASVAAELHELVRAHPLRERLWALLLEALYRSGRQADALAAFQQLREREVEELGCEPGPELQQLHEAILRQELPPSASQAAEAELDGGDGAVVGGGSPVGVRWACRRDLPLAGREAELAALRGALEEARGGQRRFVLVAGEPGVGKTRLVAELADAATGEGVAVRVGRCAEGAGVPFQPFVEVLRVEVAATSDERLGGRLGEGAGELSRLLPELSARTGQEPAPSSTSPELDQYRLFGAVAGWLSAASAHEPLLLVLEDLHAATRPTLLLLRHLVQAGAGSRLLVVATYRDTDDARSIELVEMVAELARQPEISQLSLEGLPLAAVAELVVAGLGGVDDEAWEQAEAVHAATAGNALFVQELLASVSADAGTQPAQQLAGAGVPWSLRQLLEARLQRLGGATLRLLEQAAVAGEAFVFPVVAEAGGLEEDAALDALEQAIAARLVLAVDEPRERYAFSHSVMRSALLDRLSGSRRMRLHARLAAVLERRHADDPGAVVSELAYHHSAAGAVGDPAKALAFAWAAGDGAMAQLAYDEAGAHYETALELLDAESSKGRSRELLERRCDLLTALGEAQQRAGPGVHSETLLEAIRLAVKLDDAERIARAAWVGQRGFPRHLFSVDWERVAVLEQAVAVMDEHQAGPRATVLAVLAGELTFADDPSRTHRLSDEALALARRADETVLARVLALRQFTLLNPATVADRLEGTAELVPLVDRLGDPSLRVFARWWRAVAALQAADRPEVDACVDEACRLAEELGEPFMGCASLMLAANRELMWGDLDEVAKLMDRYYELAQLADAVDIDGPYTFHLVWLHRERNRLEELIPQLEEQRAKAALPHVEARAAWGWWEVGRREEALAVLERFVGDGFESVPFDLGWVHTLCPLAEIAAEAGHTAAKRLRELLAPYADQLAADAASCNGPVAYYLGRLATALGDWDAAEVDLEQAAGIVDRVGAARWANRVALARARLLLARGRAGDREAATELLQATAAAAQREGQAALERACEELHRRDLPVG